MKIYQYFCLNYSEGGIFVDTTDMETLNVINITAQG